MKNKYTTNSYLAGLSNLLIACFVIVLASCSVPEIGKQYTPNEYQAQVGDSVMINWHFVNADRVYVDGLKNSFEPIDSMKVAAEYSKEFVVRAYQGNIDSLIDRKLLIVDGQLVEDNRQVPKNNSQTVADSTAGKSDFVPNENPNPKYNDAQPIQRGPIKPFPNYQESTSEESEYFRGISDGNNNPELLRVTRTMHEKTNQGWKIYLRALLLDKYGNFVKKDIRKSSSSFTLEYGCDDQKFSNVTFSNSKMIIPPPNAMGCDFSILLDNSLASTDNKSIVEALSKFSEGLTQQDRIQFSIFNHKPTELIPMQSPETAMAQFRNLTITEPSGLNAFYKAVYKSIEQFPKSSNCKALVVLTHYNDNSSLVYTAADLINISQHADVPIYIIAVGDALKTYFLNYICGSSGGRLYHIFDDEAKNIPNILNEIAFSLKNYYQIVFTIFDLPSDIIETGKAGKCDELQTTLRFDSEGSELKTNVNIFPHPIPEYSQYQAVAIFDNKSSIITNEYYSLLDSLAITLLDNPEYSIELIGNTGEEGIDSFNLQLSQKRAEAIKQYLVNQGVPSTQLITKSRGYRKPLYYMSHLPWQEGFNRRVEIRWLEPDKYPFEIVAGEAESEDKAQYLEDTWRKRGYRSYYERVIESGFAHYQIKLWGYSSYQEAKTAITTLEKKFKKDNFYIE